MQISINSEENLSNVVICVINLASQSSEIRLCELFEKLVEEIVLYLSQLINIF